MVAHIATNPTHPARTIVERRVLPLLPLLLVAVLLPAAAAEAAPFEFADPRGDVTRDGEAYSDSGAPSTDVVAAGVREVDATLEFHLVMQDLSELPALAKDLEFHAQYALHFRPRPDHEGYSMRALFGGLHHTTNPLGAWRFQVHDREADTWSDAQGRQDGSTLRWTVTRATFGLADRQNITAWGVQAWLSFSDGSQTNDVAGSGLLYQVGVGPIDPTVAPPPASGGAFAFDDPIDDVERGGEPYRGGSAATTDVVSASLGEWGDDLVFRLQLNDLGPLRAEAQQPGFHAQYALGFRTSSDHAGYEVRALYGGPEYASGDGWRWQIHNRETGEWPDANGRVEGATLVWVVDRPVLGVEPGSTMANWSVQTWNSYASGEQYGDWAGTAQAYVTGSGGPVAPGVPDPSEGDHGYPGAAVMIAGLSLAGGAWWARRVEPTTRFGWMVMGVVGGFSRVRRDELLDHRTRDHIVESVRQFPGRRASDVRQDLELPRTTFWYHVRRLEREGLVRAARSNGAVRLSVPEAVPRPMAAGLDARQELLKAVAEAPGGSARDYARRLNRSARTVGHQLQQLAREGSLREERRNPRDIRWSLPPNA